MSNRELPVHRLARWATEQREPSAKMTVWEWVAFAAILAGLVFVVPVLPLP